MNTRTTIILASLLIALSVLAGLFLYPRLPDPVASHWNARGQVDGYMPRFWGAFLMPIVSAGMLLLFLLIPLIDPLRANIAKFRTTFNTFIVLMIVFLLYIHGLSLAWNLGYRFDMGTVLMPAMGLLFFYMGVLMQRAKRNWFIGIRTPWTLSSDRVWDETHRLGAILFKIAGVLALAGVFFGQYAIWLVLIPVLAVAIFLLVYSYVLYQRETSQA